MPLDPSQVQWDAEPVAKPRPRYDAPESIEAFRAAANDLGIDPVDLATVVSYETGGTFDPDQVGPTTKWGQHRGLIQFGAPQRQKYGVVSGQSIPEQLPAVVAYLRDAGVKPGMGIMDVYSAINAGAPGRYNASDTAAGGAPGTVADKVNFQMGDHRRRAAALFAGGGIPTEQIQWDAPAIAVDQVQWDAPPAAAAPEAPGYFGGIADALGNLFTGEQPVLERLAIARDAIEPEIVRGVRGRAAELGSKFVRGVANVAEPVGDFLETNIPLSGLTPEQIQNEKQLQPLYDLSDVLQEYAGDNRYEPTTTFEDVKANPLSLDTPTFIAEQAALSAPDMAASVFALPAYVLGRTEEIGERRVQNDAAPTLSDLVTGEQPAAAPGAEPGLGDLAAALPGALAESLLERYATGRLPGAAPGGSAVGNVLRETAVQAGTEALEEGAANLGESVGTRRGVDAGELGNAMGAGALVGGGLGAGVRTVTEAANAVRGPAIDPGKVQWDEPAATQQENAQPASQQVPEPAEPVSASTPEAAPMAATAAPTEPAVTPAASEAAPVEAAPEPLPAPVEVATPKVAEATEEPPAARQRFASPDDMARGDFVQRAVQRGVPEDVATELAPRATVDEVTGYYDGRAQGVKANTVERAQEHVLNTGESAFYVDGDIVNLGGLNKAAKDDMTVANRHFRAMTDILRSELEAVGADVVPMRTGGDELGAVVINTGEAEIRAAMQQADAKIRAYAAQNGLDTIPHTKQGRTDVGVGLHLGLSPIVPGVTPSEIFTRASAEVNQSKEGVNVSRNTVAGAGLVAPEGQAAGAERGIGENPAGLRPEDRSAEGAEGAPQAAPASAQQPRAAQGVAAERIEFTPNGDVEKWDDGTEIIWGKTPFKPLDARVELPKGRDIESAEIREVDLADLRSSQGRITKNGLDKERDDSRGLPLVVRSNGVSYIQDGHHRLSAELFNGGTKARVRYIDLDAKKAANDRSAVPDEQEDAEVDGEDAAPRETVELEDRIESAGERNTRKKGASDEFMRASFTNRRSWAQAAYRDAGLDPDAAELLPVDKQFEAAAAALKNKFGLTAQKTPKALGRMAVDNALDLYRNAQTMAHVLGLPEKAVGLGDTLTLLFRGDAPYLGAMYPKGGKVEGVDLPAGAIALPGRSNSFAHEWGHALDLYLAGKYGMDGMVTRNVRNDGIDAQPDTSREAFANLMNAMFFGEAALAARVMALQQMATNGTDKQQAAAKQALEKIAKGNSKLKIDGSKYLIESKAFGASVGGKAGAKYFGDAAEMMARAFEAYVAEKVEAAGGSTEVLAKGDSAYLSNTDDRFAKTFPKLDERLKIFAAFDDLFGQLAKEQLVAQGVAASNPGNIDTFDPRLWLQDTGRPQNYRGIAGAWREQVDDWNAARERSRRAKERPADPVSRKARIQNALMAWTTPIQGVFRVMEARYPKSKAMRELANKLVTAPGVNRVVDRVYEQAVRITMGRGYNQFGNIVDRYQLNKLSDADRITLRRLLVSAQDPGRAPQELVKAAAELRRFMDTLWYDNQEAGINIGYTKNGYLPRMMDMAMVQADPEAFVKAAAEAYAVQLENDEMVEPEEVGETAEKMARAWLHNMLSAPAMDFASKSPAENYTKHRSLPAEADVLLEKFYVNDPLEVIHRYIGMSAKNTEFATMFGPKGEQLNDLFAQMAGEGVSLEDQKYLQGTVNSLMGRQSPGVLDGKPRAQALMNQVNAYGVMSMLGRVLISSIAEPGMAGIRTGSAAAVYKPYFNLFKQVIGTADMKQWREITRAIGLIGDAQADMVVQARIGGTYESTPKTDARLARYFSLTGLHALTNAQRVSLMPVTHQYLQSLVSQVKTGSAAEMKEGLALLAELGIKNAGEFDIGDTAPTMADLFDRDGRETEFGAQYMTAMSRINEQIVQAPNRYDRPEMANSPTGRFLYGIMSFNLAFWNNVYKREANVLKRQAKERGALGVASYVGGHMVPPLTAYFFTQLLVTAAREALLNPQRWEEWDRDEKLVENLVMLTISRAFPAGLFDIPIQAYQGLKYQRDITSIAVGAVPSYFLMSAQKVAAAFREENSDKTNNAEFGAMQGAYQLLANPLIAHILTSAPGGRILDPLYGIGIAVGTSAAARDTAAQAVVGERDSLVAKRKRDERKAAGTGVESAGDRGSSRGSVRNTDQRGSTR